MLIVKRIILVICITCISGLTQADLILAAEHHEDNRPNFQSEGQAPKIGNRQATARVLHQYPDTKILSIKLIQGEGRALYKVKMITEAGVVKSVFVDGMNGEIIE